MADPATDEKIRNLLGIAGTMTELELRAFRFHVAAQIAGTGQLDQHGFAIAAAAARRDAATVNAK